VKYRQKNRNSKAYWGDFFRPVGDAVQEPASSRVSVGGKLAHDALDGPKHRLEHGVGLAGVTAKAEIESQQTNAQRGGKSHREEVHLGCRPGRRRQHVIGHRQRGDDGQCRLDDAMESLTPDDESIHARAQDGEEIQRQVPTCRAA
jgi:hypothetical protein